MKIEKEKRWFVLDETPLVFKEKPSDKAVFRYISFDRLLQMLNEKKNFLVKTALWEDVYENFLLKENIKIEGASYSDKKLLKLQDLFFGQCWTRKMASDAIWRIYSPDKKCIRIKTSLIKLYNLGLNLSKKGSGNCLFGKVNYYPLNKIEEDIKNFRQVSQDELTKILLQSFFVKRVHFSHEAEYRLIFMSKSYKQDNVVSINIDPIAFIENIYFDPRADDQYVTRCSRILIDAFGYPKERIHKSDMYSFNPLTINVV